MDWPLKFDESSDGETRWLRHMRLPSACLTKGLRQTLPVAGDGLHAADLGLCDGIIAEITPALAETKPMGTVWPRFVDCHSHIDKGLMVRRHPNPEGTFAGAASAFVNAYKEGFSQEDMCSRADFQIASAYANGTGMLRSHVDMTPENHAYGFAALCDLTDRWRDRIDVQLVPFFGVETEAESVPLFARLAADQGQPAISAFLYAHPVVDDFLGRVFKVAADHGLDLDFHADENLDPTSDMCERIADWAEKTAFKGRIMIGHGCALSLWAEDRLSQVLARLARFRVHFVSLPLCNSYLMDREVADPKHRGFAPVHAIRDAGIPVALASDNMADAYHAYGDLDMVETFRFAVRAMHLDHPIMDWPAAITRAPGAAIGTGETGLIAPGSAADLVVFKARNWTEFMCRPQSDRLIIKGGSIVSAPLPDWQNLDHLKGLSP